MQKITVGNKLILEAYKKEGLKSTVSNGFAMVQQKVALKGLRVLVDAQYAVGQHVAHVPAGAIAYIKEESLHTAAWAVKVLESEAIGEPFIIVDLNNVEFISVGE